MVPILITRSLDFLKLTTYLVFFTIIITFYGLPLNIVRDVYITARSFISRLRALHRYQTATRNMDQRYPNATEEEMSAMSDRTCIICREEMVLREPAENPTPPVNADGPNITPKKLPCGHIFHFHCLRSWLERQQNCPTWLVLSLSPVYQSAEQNLIKSSNCIRRESADSATSCSWGTCSPSPCTCSSTKSFWRSGRSEPSRG